MEKRVPTQIHTRKLDRLVAHVNMAKRKFPHVNKHDYFGSEYMKSRTRSYFAEHWRQYTDSVPVIDVRR